LAALEQRELAALAEAEAVDFYAASVSIAAAAAAWVFLVRAQVAVAGFGRVAKERAVVVALAEAKGVLASAAAGRGNTAAVVHLAFVGKTPAQ
jgi:hypothetical protein